MEGLPNVVVPVDGLHREFHRSVFPEANDFVDVIRGIIDTVLAASGLVVVRRANSSKDFPPNVVQSVGIGRPDAVHICANGAKLSKY